MVSWKQFWFYDSNFEFLEMYLPTPNRYRYIWSKQPQDYVMYNNYFSPRVSDVSVTPVRSRYSSNILTCFNTRNEELWGVAHHGEMSILTLTKWSKGADTLIIVVIMSVRSLSVSTRILINIFCSQCCFISKVMYNLVIFRT